MNVTRNYSICLTCLTLLAAHTQLGASSSLISNSPFLPPQIEAQENLSKEILPSINPDFTLKGISKIGEKYLFSIHDLRTNKSKWILAGEETNGFAITSYEPITKTINYRWNNRTYSLKLQASKGEPIPLVYVESAAQKHITAPNSTVSSNQGASNSNVHTKRLANTDTHFIERNSPKLQGDASSIISFKRTEQVNAYYGDEGDIISKPQDLFATTDQAAVEQLIASTTPPPRYSLKRNNQVENPNGKIPDHLR